MNAGRIAKFASAFTLLCVATIIGLWWTFVRAPSPEEVCGHIIDVTLAESEATGMSQDSQGAVIEQTRRECIQHKRDKLQLRDRVTYAEYAKCVMAGETLEEIYGC